MDGALLFNAKKSVRVPDNVRFEISDIESDWEYKENSFDYIHSKYMLGSITDWEAMIQRAYQYVQSLRSHDRHLNSLSSVDIASLEHTSKCRTSIRTWSPMMTA